MSFGQTPPREVLAEFGLDQSTPIPLGQGLINETWLVEAESGRFVLQRMNEIFPVAINQDIDRVTRHLQAQNMLTCLLVPAQNGALSVEFEGRNWRLLTYVDGVSHNSLDANGRAHEAGDLLARFHRAVDGLDCEFATQRPGVHDTPRHLAFLRSTLETQSAHREFSKVARIAERILTAADDLPALTPTADRIVHGDPKINNILFSRDGDTALCLVDFDTLTRMPLPLELGDAMRSWCNPAGENDRVGEFSAHLFSHAVHGYAAAAGDWISTEEAGAIVTATQTILVELAARFCADALNESYFGWDSERFETRSDHNQVRAQSQLTVVRSLIEQRVALDDLVGDAFGL